MFKRLAAFGKVYENYMINRGRVEAREILLRHDDATLRDIGIVRSELIGGVKNWPWDGSATKPASVMKKVGTLKTAAKTLKAEEKEAVEQLKSFTDRQLQDIGINRGMILDAVVNGREDQELGAMKFPAQPAGNDRHAA